MCRAAAASSAAPGEAAAAVGGFGKMVTRAQSDQLTRRAPAHPPRAVRIEQSEWAPIDATQDYRPYQSSSAGPSCYAASPLQKLR